MKQFIRSLELIEDFSTEIKIEKIVFLERFKSSVDEGNTGIFSDILDAFSSSKNQFKGHVGLDNFKIKRRRRFFDIDMNFAVAEGTYRQQGESLIIEAEINGFKNFMIPFYLLALAFYAFFIVVFISADDVTGLVAILAFPFIVVHAAFMLGIPYLMMRRSVMIMKHELERGFYYMTK